MADTSGALLARAGIVTPEELAKANSIRQRDGGSLGECLVRIGAIDEERLVQFYHKRLMVPRVAAAKLMVVAPEVLELVPPEMAAEFRCVPIDLDAEGITLAMSDPSDNHAVDEIAFFADRFVLRAVAAESAVRRAIEKHYGIRFTSPLASATPAPEPEPPRVESPPEEPAEEPPPVEYAPEEPEPVLLTRVKRSEETPLPMPVPPPDDYTPQYADPAEPILLSKPKERKRTTTDPGLTIPVPDPPLPALRAATARDEVAQLLLDYLALLLQRALLFVIKKPLLVGQDARGERIDPIAVKALAIHLEAPSIFRDVVAARLPYRGPLPETPANRAFAQTVGGVGSEVLIMPIAVRDRIIAVLFADGARMPLPDAALHATCREAGLAYERLILEAKGR
ncbi:MAG TPA: hypothetical protein VII38_07365 [Polyangia bacterium]|jgi:hypothetical protein